MTSTMIWTLAAFVVYLLGMLLIGAAYMKKNKNSEDFFLGGRGLSGAVAALSAQASDMSGWMLMGLPGTVYALGTGQIWIAIGLLIGTILNWLLVSGRLRRYTIRANNSITLPKYLENRFHDKNKILLVVSSIAIVIFFTVYTASALSSGGKLFNSVFGIDYKICLTIGAVVILAYTFMGGFMAVCITDFIQGMLMLVGVITIPIIAAVLVGAGNIMDNIAATGVNAEHFLNVMNTGDGEKFSAVDIISQLGWALGYFGMPHILVRFMAIRDEKELKKSKFIGCGWCAISLAFACFIGVIGRAYLPLLAEGKSENVFIEMIQRVFNKDICIPFIGGIFLCGVLAAIMSTADSQLLVTASSVSEDIYHSLINKKADNKRVLLVSRITVLCIAVIAYLIALDPKSSIMGLVSNAWAGLGASFGPIVLMSLYWKRTNLAGAAAGIAGGAATVLLWDYPKIIGGQTIAEATGLYSLVSGFIVSILLIVIVSLATKAPDEEILKEFEDVQNKVNCGCDEGTEA